MSFSVQIIRHPLSPNSPHEEEYYSLREVHYTKDNIPASMSAEPIRFASSTAFGVIQQLKHALDSALSHEVLDDPWPDEGP